MDDCTKERFATLIMEVMELDEEEYECYKRIMKIKNDVLVQNFFNYTDYVRIQKRGSAAPLFCKYRHVLTLICLLKTVVKLSSLVTH